jgi:peptide methionine sulfoxide reductase MsrA
VATFGGGHFHFLDAVFGDLEGVTYVESGFCGGKSGKLSEQ